LSAEPGRAWPHQARPPPPGAGPTGPGRHGFRPRTSGAIVDGITESAVRAHGDLAPAGLYLTHGELHDASINRSPTSGPRR